MQRGCRDEDTEPLRSELKHGCLMQAFPSPPLKPSPPVIYSQIPSVCPLHRHSPVCQPRNQLLTLSLPSRCAAQGQGLCSPPLMCVRGAGTQSGLADEGACPFSDYTPEENCPLLSVCPSPVPSPLHAPARVVFTTRLGDWYRPRKHTATPKLTHLPNVTARATASHSPRGTVHLEFWTPCSRAGGGLYVNSVPGAVPGGDSIFTPQTLASPGAAAYLTPKPGLSVKVRPSLSTFYPRRLAPALAREGRSVQAWGANGHRELKQHLDR